MALDSTAVGEWYYGGSPVKISVDDDSTSQSSTGNNEGDSTSITGK